MELLGLPEVAGRQLQGHAMAMAAVTVAMAAGPILCLLFPSSYLLLSYLSVKILLLIEIKIDFAV